MMSRNSDLVEQEPQQNIGYNSVLMEFQPNQELNLGFKTEANVAKMSKRYISSSMDIHKERPKSCNQYSSFNRAKPHTAMVTKDLSGIGQASVARTTNVFDSL